MQIEITEQEAAVIGRAFATMKAAIVADEGWTDGNDPQFAGFVETWRTMEIVEGKIEAAK